MFAQMTPAGLVDRFFAWSRGPAVPGLVESVAREVETMALAADLEALAVEPRVAGDLGLERQAERHRAVEARRTPRTW